MLKVKNVVAVAILFVAAGAMASNFRAADQVYVPVAGHVAGGSGTFISDVFISNLTSDPVSVSVIFASGAGGAQQTFNNVITLAALLRLCLVQLRILGCRSGRSGQGLHYRSPHHGARGPSGHLSRKHRSGECVAVFDDHASGEALRWPHGVADRHHVPADTFAPRPGAAGSRLHVPFVHGSDGDERVHHRRANEQHAHWRCISEWLPERLPGVLRLRFGARQRERRRHHTRAAVSEVTVGSRREPRRDRLHLQRELQNWACGYHAPRRQTLISKLRFFYGWPRPQRGLFVYHFPIP